MPLFGSGWEGFEMVACEKKSPRRKWGGETWNNCHALHVLCAFLTLCEQSNFKRDAHSLATATSISIVVSCGSSMNLPGSSHCSVTFTPGRWCSNTKMCDAPQLVARTFLWFLIRALLRTVPMRGNVHFPSSASFWRASRRSCTRFTSGGFYKHTHGSHYYRSHTNVYMPLCSLWNAGTLRILVNRIWDHPNISRKIPAETENDEGIALSIWRTGYKTVKSHNPMAQTFQNQNLSTTKLHTRKLHNTVR